MNNCTNPIIPGFHPDPSICRGGDDYYLVNSSFEFFPGVPLFHSRDLTHWEQLGHVLTRKSQLNLNGCRTSGGIYAPTLRHHNGRFYMVTTNVSHGGNFYVWTDDIHGEWSDPIWVKQPGIDPSLFFDEDGLVYFSSTAKFPEGHCIGQCLIDIETGEMLTETKDIWYGTGGKYPEGPHLYKRNGRYYLMIAEGGTEYGHMVTIARSVSPWGPFESCPRNPILTHRNAYLDETPFQALGHADIVESTSEHFIMVFHGIRPTQYMLHHIGRETMIASVEWDDDGWPLVNSGRIILPELQLANPPKEHIFPALPVREEFNPPVLAKSWSFLRNPDESRYLIAKRPGFLGLTASEATLDDLASPTLICRRQQHFDFCTQTLLEYMPEDENAKAGLTIFHTNEQHYDLLVTRREGCRCVLLRKRVADILTLSDLVYVPEEGPILLQVEATKWIYTFSCGTDPNALQEVGTGRTQLLSTECTGCTFTGCFVGLFAEGSGTAWIDWFSYNAL